MTKLHELFRKERKEREAAGVVSALCGNELVHYYGREDKRSVSKGYISKEGLTR